MNATPPLIAINGLYIEAEVPYLKLAERYARSILKAGGLPFVLPPMGGPLDAERLLDRVDGLLLTGGDDFDTERLGLGPTHPSACATPGPKQDWDFELARTALEREIPTLGVCYGMQVLGLLGGGGFLQHLPEDRPEGQNHSGNVLHSVRVEADSKLHGVLGVGELDVVSQHHQALSEVPSPWRVVARDTEGLVEAIEHLNHPFCVGVQWHPEKTEEGDVNHALFRGLVDASGLNAARRLSALEIR